MTMSTTPVTPFMYDTADSRMPPNSFSIIEQEMVQAYLTFQADLLPARSSSAQAQDFQSDPNSTSPLIHKTYNGFLDFLDFERFTFYLLVTRATMPTNFLPMLLTPLCKLVAIIFASLLAVLQGKSSIIRWLSRKKIEERNVPSSLPWTILLPLKHWDLDLVRQSILFKGASMARRLMLVTTITLICKNSFAST